MKRRIESIIMYAVIPLVAATIWYWLAHILWSPGEPLPLWSFPVAVLCFLAGMLIGSIPGRRRRKNVAA